MTLKKVGVQFQAQDINPFVQAVTSGNKAVEQFGQTATKSAKSTDDLAAAQKRALNIADLTDKIGLQRSKLANLNDELEKTKKKYGESSAQAHRKEEAIAALNAKITSGERVLNSYQQQIQREYQEQQKATQATQAAISPVNRLEDSTKKLDGGVKNLAQSTDHAGAKINAFGEMAIGAFRRVGEMAVNFAMDAGRALIGLGGDTITVAADYESTLNRFSSVTLDAMTEAGLSLKDYDALFLELGKSTQFSAQQAADAGVELAKGGVAIEEILGGATEATLNLAAAAELELAPAAEIVAKNLAVWGDTGVTAADVSNLMTQAANASSVSVEELQLGLANVGGRAKAAGVEFDDLVQTLALIAPGFASASDAGTALKTMIGRLIPQTKAQVGMMDQLGLYTMDYKKALEFLIEEGVLPATASLAGMKDPAEEINAAFTDYLVTNDKLVQGTDEFNASIEALYKSFGSSVFFDTEGSFIGMAGAAGELNKALADLSEHDKLGALKTLFGDDADRAGFFLAQAGAAGFDAMGASMERVGIAADQAKRLQLGYNFSLEQAKGSFETLQIILGRAVLPLLGNLLDNYITPGINKMLDFATAISQSSTPFDDIAAAVGTFIGQFGPLGFAVQNLIDIFIRGQDNLANWGFLERSLMAAFNQFVDFGARVGSWILTSIPGWIETFGGLIGGLGVVIVEHIPEILTELGDVLTAMGDWVTASAPAWGQQLLAFGQYAVSWISDQLPMLGEALGRFFNRMVTWVVDSLPTWVANLQTLGKAAIQWVIDALPGLSANLGTMAGNLLGWIGQTAIDVVPKLFLLAGKFLAWVATDVMPMLPGVLDAIAQGIINFIVSTGEALAPYLAELAVKTYKWITDDVVPGVQAGFDTVWTTISTWVADTVAAIPGKTKEIGTQLIMGMVGGVTASVGRLVDAVTGALGSAVQGAADFLLMRSPSRLFRDKIGIYILPGVAEGVYSTQGQLDTAITSSLGGAMDTGLAITKAGRVAITGNLQGLLGDVHGYAQQIGAAWVRASSMQGDPSAAISAPAQGSSMMPVTPRGNVYNRSVTTDNSRSITYNPTYNSPAPPPAMSYGQLNALAGV